MGCTVEIVCLFLSLKYFRDRMCKVGNSERKGCFTGPALVRSKGAVCGNVCLTFLLYTIKADLVHQPGVGKHFALNTSVLFSPLPKFFFCFFTEEVIKQ